MRQQWLQPEHRLQQQYINKMKKYLILLLTLASCKGTYTIIDKFDCEVHYTGVICKVKLQDKKKVIYDNYVKIPKDDTTNYIGKKLRLNKKLIKDNIHSFKIN